MVVCNSPEYRASFANPLNPDASIQMTITELTTAAQFNIGVKVIVFNNEEQVTSIIYPVLLDTLTIWTGYGDSVAESFL